MITIRNEERMLHDALVASLKRHAQLGWLFAFIGHAGWIITATIWIIST